MRDRILALALEADADHLGVSVILLAAARALEVGRTDQLRLGVIVHAAVELAERASAPRGGQPPPQGGGGMPCVA